MRGPGPAHQRTSATSEAAKLRGARQGRWLLAGCLAIDFAAIGWFASTSGRRDLIWAREVGQALAEFAKSPQAARRLRVNGVLVSGSVKAMDPYGVTFRLRSSWAEAAVSERSSELLVRCERCGDMRGICDLPGLEAELSVEGQLVREGAGVVFAAERMLMKCPGKYERAGARTACERAPEHLRRRCPWCSEAPD